MKKFSVLLLMILLVNTSCDPKTLSQILESGSSVLSETEIAGGLKEALNKGVEESVSYLSAQDGYYKSVYKILLPEEANVVISRLKVIPGFSNVEEEIIKRINHAAEDAASKAGPIFFSAIRQLTFNDVTNILMGEKNAATNYLIGTTYQPLYTEFKPVIVASLNKFGALDYWADAVNAYNKIPFVSKINPDMADHVASKSLSGLFDMVEKKEYGIRTDISQRTSSLLKKVFAKQD